MELLSLASVTKRMTTVSCVYGNMLGDMLIEIRIENKGLEVTGESNAREWGDHTIAVGVQVLRIVIYGTNVYDL